MAYGDNKAPWEPEIDGLYSRLDGRDSMRKFDKDRGIKAAHVLTVTRPEHMMKFWGRLAPRIRGKTVVEIGAGVGLFARRMAKIARHVYAIEAAPEWNYVFAKWLSGLGGWGERTDKVFAKTLRRELAAYPRNLTWIYGSAEALVGRLHVDVAVVLTGSDEAGLRALAGKFAPTIIMPWQDWYEGKARARIMPFGIMR